MGSLAKQGSKYTDEDRRKVVVEYFVTGNMKEVSRRVNIPRTTLNSWKESDWWDEETVKVRHEKGDEFDANLSKLIDSAFGQTQDRVDNGDYRVNKDGELIRVPMSGRDLVITGGTVYDKQRLHRNEATSITSNANSQDAALKFLEQIADTYREKHRQVNSIEGDCEEIT